MRLGNGPYAHKLTLLRVTRLRGQIFVEAFVYNYGKADVVSPLAHPCAQRCVHKPFLKTVKSGIRRLKIEAETGLPCIEYMASAHMQLMRLCVIMLLCFS